MTTWFYAIDKKRKSLHRFTDPKQRDMFVRKGNMYGRRDEREALQAGDKRIEEMENKYNPLAHVQRQSCLPTVGKGKGI